MLDEIMEKIRTRLLLLVLAAALASPGSTSLAQSAEEQQNCPSHNPSCR
ncbi:MAG TPA: hypothetical protein VJ994_13150 [Paracoccaceae bacterium]|nr:hypothetical protein [Paracoccaceae bacterium]